MPAMRRFPSFAFLFATLLLLTAPGRGDEKTTPAAAVKLLTVGNSFSSNSTAFLPDFAKAAGKQLILFRADLGGHSLQQHVGYLQAYEANHTDPKGSPYKKVDPRTGKVCNISLCAALESEPWDYVTIQQVSHLSFRAETYEPYARILIDYIRQHAPKAKILIHETWAYREDHPLLASERITQQKMFKGLREAYRQLASRYSLEIIPVGDAIQTARSQPQWEFHPDKTFDFANPKPGALPADTGGLNAGWSWGHDPKTGKEKLVLDAKHCNVPGRYLGAAVFYEKLFSHVEEVTFVPPKMKPDDAAALRKIAHDTVMENKLQAETAVGKAQ